MKHDYSLAALSVLSLAPPQQIDVAARTGYQYVGLRLTMVTPTEPHHDMVRNRALFCETKARLAATGIKVLDVELFRLDAGTEPESLVGELDVTAELGARDIICQLPDPDRSRKIERFARLCELAKKRGLFVNLEFPYWTQTGTFAEAAHVVRSVRQDNAGILVDMLHFGRSASKLDDLRAAPREWFRMAHLCDAAKERPETMDANMHSVRSERMFPGEGNIGVREILACLPPKIPYVLEIPKDVMTDALGPEETARVMLRCARSYVDGDGM